MIRIALCLAISVFVSGCATTRITSAKLDTATENLDFGDFSSTTLTTKAWQALAEKDYPAVFACGRECVRRYGEEGRRMNAEMTGFVSSDALRLGISPTKTAFVAFTSVPGCGPPGCS